MIVHKRGGQGQGADFGNGEKWMDSRHTLKIDSRRFVGRLE